MTATVDQRLGFSAQLEQCDHGWRDARDGDLADAAAWLTALRGVLDRVNGSAALRTIEATYHAGLRELSARVAALVQEAQGGAVDPVSFRERGDKLFADALLLIDGAGL